MGTAPDGHGSERTLLFRAADRAATKGSGYARCLFHNLKKRYPAKRKCSPGGEHFDFPVFRQGMYMGESVSTERNRQKPFVIGY